MKNIRAIAIKEFLHVIRDTRTLRIIVLLPLLQLVIYGYAINTDVKHLSTVVYDQDQTFFSRRLMDAFRESAYFDIKRHARSPEELYSALDRGNVKVGLLIPPDFTKDVFGGRGANVQMLIDGTDSTPATAALNTSQAIIAQFMQNENLVAAQRPPIDFRPRLWYNPDLKSTYFLVPGLIGLLLTMLIPMITATAIVREKERGNIEQLLVTPIKPYELMIGKLIPYICIGMIISTSIVLAARFMFQIPLRGNPLTLMTLTFLFLLVCLGIGLLASTIADNQQQAAQIVMMQAAPSILLSGFIFPRETMPPLIHTISYGIPLTYFVQIVRGIVLKGLGFADLWNQIWPLLVMAAGILWLSTSRFHKRLK